MGFIIEEEYRERRKQLFENAGIPDPQQNSNASQPLDTTHDISSFYPSGTTTNQYDADPYNVNSTTDPVDVYNTIPTYPTDDIPPPINRYTDPSPTDNYYSTQTYTSSYNSSYDQPTQSYPSSSSPSDRDADHDSTTNSRQQSFYANFSSQKNAVVVYRKQVYGVQQSLPLTEPTGATILRHFDIPVTNSDFVLVQSKTGKEVPLSGFSNVRIPPGSYLLQEKPTLIHRSGTSFLIHGNKDITKPSFDSRFAFRGFPATGPSYHYHSSSYVQGEFPNQFRNLNDKLKQAIITGQKANGKGTALLNEYLEFCQGQGYSVILAREPTNPDEVRLLLHNNGDANSRGELVDETRGREYGVTEQRFGYCPAEVLQELFNSTENPHEAIKNVNRMKARGGKGGKKRS
mmetsp:Transcript_9627/g.13260  ORF Transcript_9627/g.13260 Transcript_9627/m.13260 type:complete len:402 (+) Transcript_9627:62-1267(+)